MQPILANYFPILVFLGIAVGIASAMVGGSLLSAKQKPYAEKLSAYECGFEPFDDARRRFDVRFYLVAILFIIFDLEGGVPVPVGSEPLTYWHGRVLVDDWLPCRPDRRLYLRVVPGGAGVGVA